MTHRSYSLLAAVALVLVALAAAPRLFAGPAPKRALRSALEAMQAAGSYRFSMDATQVVRSAPGADPRFAPGHSVAADVRRYQIDGLARDARTLRLRVTEAESVSDVLVLGDEVYARAGDAWVAKPSAAPAPGLAGDGLPMLALARDVRQAAGGALAFTLRGEDVLPWLLRRQGLDEPQVQRLLLSRPAQDYDGEGALTLTSDGLPSRLRLRLYFGQGGAEPFTAEVETLSEYFDAGQPVDGRLFDPAVAPLTLADAPGAVWLRLKGAGVGMTALALAGIVAALCALAPRRRLLPWALAVALLLPNAAAVHAAIERRPAAQPAPSAQRELAEALAPFRRRAPAERFARPGTPDLAPADDTDDDGLPNGYELELGANPYARDSDLDGLGDADEILGVPCGGKTVATDPLNPDSNADGIRDGDEFHANGCGATAGRPNAWSDDNDGDGVPDGLDASPFSASPVMAGRAADGADAPGASLTLDVPLGGAGGIVAQQRLFYLDLQVRPAAPDSLNYAYKPGALAWPFGDDKGQIQTPLGGYLLGKVGDLTLAPFLEMRVDDEAQLPDPQHLAAYGVGVTTTVQGCAAGCAYKLTLPLAVVERDGVPVAFASRFLFGVAGSTVAQIRLRDVRLKWAVRGDTYRPGPSGALLPPPSLLTVYDEPYVLTGVKVSLQAGAQALVLGAHAPASPDEGDASTLGPAAYLRGALEARFLAGALTLADLAGRFGVGSTASITERWGLTQTWSVAGATDFRHLDQMLLTTNVTLTRQVLDAAHPSRAITPTLVIASQQSAADFNLDEYRNPDYGNLLFDLCAKPVVTTRSLKLGTYRWNPDADGGPAPAALRAAQIRASASVLGAWQQLATEPLLRFVGDNYARVMGVAQDYAGRARAYVDAGRAAVQQLYLAWHTGLSVVHQLGALDWNRAEAALTDAQLYQRLTHWLGDRGYVPGSLVRAVDFVMGVFQAPGGPAAWLESQYNTALQLVDGAGDVLRGSIPTFTLSNLVSGLRTTTLSDAMAFTRTAVGILNYMAALSGSSFLADVAHAAGVALRVLDTARWMYDLANAVWSAARAGLSAVAAAGLSALSSLAPSMGVLGAVFAIGVTLFGLVMQLGAGGLSAGALFYVIASAVLSVVKTVVLLVLAAFVPYGTLVAAALAVADAIVGLFPEAAQGAARFFLDPLGWFVSLFEPEPPSQVTWVHGAPSLQGFRIGVEPDHPFGMTLAGQPFYAEVTGAVSMFGDWNALDRGEGAPAFSLGRFADGAPFELCGQELEQFWFADESAEHLRGYPNILTTVDGTYTGRSDGTLCKIVTVPAQPGWRYQSVRAGGVASGKYITTLEPISATLSHALALPRAVRDFAMRSRLNVFPDRPAVNGVVNLDATYDLGFAFQGDDGLSFRTSRTAPSSSPMYFDILPASVGGLWNWDALISRDRDGDGILNAQDAVLCAGENYIPGADRSADIDGDGLADGRERTLGTDPCRADTDGDGAADGRELQAGLDPLNADTDGDGLRDGDELAEWPADAPGLPVAGRWQVALSRPYLHALTGLPLPAPQAFPNPRQANLDADHRGDRREKSRQSSPASRNGLAAGEGLEPAIDQQYTVGGGTHLWVTTPAWQNDAAPALDALLTITLPVAFTGLQVEAAVVAADGGAPDESAVTLPAEGQAQRFAFPPVTLGRRLYARLSGLPEAVPQAVTVTASVRYTVAGAAYASEDAVELFINRGGPAMALHAPESGALLGAGAHTFTGGAVDPQGVGSVEVCVTQEPACPPDGWRRLPGDRAWATTHAFAASGQYAWFGRATDAFGVSGPTAGPVFVDVDAQNAQAASFDAAGTRYLSTTFTAGVPMITLTGLLSDTPAAFASGAGEATVVVQGRANQAFRVPAAAPGDLVSPFTFTWTLPMGPTGGAAVHAQRAYTVLVAPTDRAGNGGGAPGELTVVVDDAPPLVRVNLPQTHDRTHAQDTLTLSGRADDQAVLHALAQRAPHDGVRTLAASDTRFGRAVYSHEAERAFIAGDLNGDAIDDVALIDYPAGLLEVGIFFGRPEGFAAARTITAADVRLRANESPVGGAYAGAPASGVGGDVNGDGVGDLLIGDPYKERAYVVLGRRSAVGDAWKAQDELDSFADFILAPGSEIAFGSAVAFAGDVDGDGIGDVLVGAQRNAHGADTATLYLGRERGAPTPAATFIGRACGACAGVIPALAGLGDTDGDGLSDMAIATGAGRAYLVLGRPWDAWPATVSLPTEADAVFEGLQGATAPTDLVFVTTGVGDLNGDGRNDWLISGDENADQGRAHVVFGRDHAVNPYPSPVPADASLYVLNPFRLGAAAPLGDLDRDGLPDIGLALDDGAGSFVAVMLGKSIPFGGSAGLQNATGALVQTGNGQRVGAWLSAGDVNGDGVRDILAGAPGEGASHVFLGRNPREAVSGIASVEVGVTGPVAPNTSPTETLPGAWHAMPLVSAGGGAVAAWRGALSTAGLADGDYRVYARAFDRAGNALPSSGWHAGTIALRNGATAQSLSDGVDAVSFAPGDEVTVGITGTLAGAHTFARVWTGARWLRLPAGASAFSVFDAQARRDLHRAVIRSVARDAFGNKTAKELAQTVDFLVAAPELRANLPLTWHAAGAAPTLVVTWSLPSDGSGISDVFAAIDAMSGTQPATPNWLETMSATLAEPGAYYGHVRVVDAAGNARTSRVGPFVVNRAATPSYARADGALQFEGAPGVSEQGEYPLGTYLNYDPYAPGKPAMYGTWDAASLYLAFDRADWRGGRGLAVYLDTRAGGQASTLGLGESAHTLPMDADVAVLFAGGAHTFYESVGGAWGEMAAAPGAAAVGTGTELVLHRAGLGADGESVGVLAYAFDAEAVTAVLPAAARPSSDALLTGSVSFAGNGLSPLRLGAPVTGAIPVLANGFGGQVLDPRVAVEPAASQVWVGMTTTLAVDVRHAAPWGFNVPLTFTLGDGVSAPPLGIIGVGGASCESCPPGGAAWRVRVEAADAKQVRFVVTATQPVTLGVFPVTATVTLAQWGLPAEPAKAARTVVEVHHAVAWAGFATDRSLLSFRPGVARLGVTAGGLGRACYQVTQVNTGGGWRAVQGNVVTDTLAAGEARLWQVRAVGVDGLVSPVASVQVRADVTTPTAELATGGVVTFGLATLAGSASDDGDVDYVEVRVGDGPFARVNVNAPAWPGGMARARLEAIQGWSAAVDMGARDGESVPVTVRAVDGAGNVGASRAYTLVVDTVAPQVTPTLSAAAPAVLAIAASDGSGVSAVEVSLDGGGRYVPAAVVGDGWALVLGSWVGPRVGAAVVRATDARGNVAQRVLVLPAGALRYAVFLPHTSRWSPP